MILDEKYMNEYGVYSGRIEEHGTVVKGTIDFACDCGNKISVKVRRELKADSQYHFIVNHRSKTFRYAAEEPTAVDVFNRMYKASSGYYSTCRFPVRKR